MIAQVIVNIPTRNINKYFSYIIPAKFDHIGVGWRVVIPFSGRKVEGFIMEVIDGDETGLKSIAETLDEAPWFDCHMITTARWLSDYYLCTLADAMRLFVPGKAGVRSRSLYSALPIENGSEITMLLAGKAPKYEQFYTYLLASGPLELIPLTKMFGPDTPKIIRTLIHIGLITPVATATATNRPKLTKYIELSVTLETAATIEKSLINRPAQKRLLSLLITKRSLPLAEIKASQISHDTIMRLAEAGIVSVRNEQVLRDSYANVCAIDRTITLTAEQQSALHTILPAISAKQHQSFLLHGITGSGKTEIYLEAVAAVRCLGRQAIVLVPEIALTNQIVSRFKARFGKDVVVIHSKLSVGERFDTWQRLQTGQAGIVIGARSAIFAPVKDLGLIVLDEEHEFTYKQEENPRYHTRQIALMRSKLASAPVILGSATPSLESYYQAQNGHHKLLVLSSRADNASLPQVVTVDMREELAQGRRTVLSETLHHLLAETLHRNEQAIIVLNRRGYATFVMCRECGYVVKCHHCSVSMVYHSPAKSLKCHYCHATQAAPDVCPSCESRYIRYFGTGTQKVEEELIKQFPKARIVRMDQDTTGGKLASDRIMTDFAAGKYDILLGTQMVAKGHDVKNVTAVGIIAADSALNLPDFRSAERTFNLLTQAAGRAGRGEKPGRVVIQTYNPDHYAIAAGAAQDYHSFYEQEITFRRQLGYPPFQHLLKITIHANSDQQVHLEANDLIIHLRRLAAQYGITSIFGPSPASVAKVNDIHRMMILIKASDMTPIKKALSDSGLTHRTNLLFDVDPVNLL